MEALVQARDEGLTRFIGVTGHGVRIAAMHARSLERFDYDSVLLPYNFVQLEDAQYRADVEHLLGVCAERRVAVQAIKAVARRRWADEATGPRAPWYEPLPPGDSLERAVKFVLDREQLFLVASSDTSLLRTILTAASTARRVAHRRPAARRHRRPRHPAPLRRRRPRTHLIASPHARTGQI